MVTERLAAIVACICVFIKERTAVGTVGNVNVNACRLSKALELDGSTVEVGGAVTYKEEFLCGSGNRFGVIVFNGELFRRNIVRAVNLVNNRHGCVVKNSALHSDLLAFVKACQYVGVICNGKAARGNIDIFLSRAVDTVNVGKVAARFDKTAVLIEYQNFGISEVVGAVIGAFNDLYSVGVVGVKYQIVA